MNIFKALWSVVALEYWAAGRQPYNALREMC